MSMNQPLRILFLCTGNSCRSQMAEGWARHLKSDVIEAYSAGIETHGLNPQAVKVMAEAGVDISRPSVQAVDELEARAIRLRRHRLRQRARAMPAISRARPRLSMWIRRPAEAGGRGEDGGGGLGALSAGAGRNSGFCGEVA